MKKTYVVVEIVKGINRRTKFDFVLQERIDNLWVGYNEEFKQGCCYNKSTNVLSFEDGDTVEDCAVIAVIRE